MHPAGVDTPMINNEFTRAWLAGLVATSGSPPDMGNALPVARNPALKLRPGS
jgi:hypothetical protein